jgi:tripartite-type tricarboxylate transporter receptor subunit TctC
VNAIRQIVMIVFCTALMAVAQDFPQKPVRMIVAFSPGASTDILGRAVAQRLSEVFGQPVIVENRVGAGGTAGGAYVAKSPADGYTLLMANNSSHNVAPYLYKNMPYDAIRDFAPVALAARLPLMLTVHPSLPVHSVREFIAFARSRPGQLLFSSSGIGTSLHLAGELFKTMAGINIVHVPYKGASIAMIDLVGGQVQLSFAALATALPYAKQNRVRPLGVTTLKRSTLLPDVPTISEAALPGYEMSNWVGLLAPAQTPAEIVARLNAEVVKWALERDTQQKMTTLGFEVDASSPAGFGEMVAKGYSTMGSTVKAAGLKPE